MPNRPNYGGLPGAPQPIINYPENVGFIVFEEFETLNTKPPRPAIKDSEMAWCDGWMPFGPSNLRTLYGKGDSIYTAASGVTINAFWFYNFGDTSYAAVLRSDGGLDQVDVSSMAVTTIMAAGTLQNPDPHNTGISLWSSKYLVIASNQDNGYWLWDGTHLYGSSGISPDAVITNAGQGYTSAPTVNFQTTSGTAVAPTFTATVTNGFVTDLTVDTPGSAFAVDDLIDVWFTGGGSDDTAYVIPSIAANSGQVTNVVVTGSVSNLASTAYVTLDGGGGTGATAALVASNGAIQSITVTNGGMGYTSSPTVTLHGSHTGTFSAVAEVSFGQITLGSVVNAGSGYKSPPVITVLGDGTGAQATAVINNAGQVTQVVMDNVGYGYTKAIFHLDGGNNAAAASVSLMPVGIQGTTVETYVNRVWVGDEKKGYFTAPASPSDFTTSNGAGAFQSTDSFQRVAYHSFKQTNGFLYLISDSSVNYIGGVQSSGTTTVQTVFNNLNVDPQIGTPWPSTVQLFSRNLVFANSFGIFVSYGGAVAKISGPLDGVYNTVVTPGSGTPLLFPSSATASLFGIAVYMLLFPIIDPYTGQQVNKLLIWDGKRWFSSNQEVALTYIASQEINSVLTAWGTDGTNIFPMFRQPSTGFQKVVQSKLWANPSYWFKKTTPNVAGLLNFNNTTGTVTVIVDNEASPTGSVSVDVLSTGAAVWLNQSNVIVTWYNASTQVVTWGSPGLALIEPQQVSDGQVGTLVGITVTTDASDVTLISLALLEQNYQYKA